MRPADTVLAVSQENGRVVTKTNYTFVPAKSVGYEKEWCFEKDRVTPVMVEIPTFCVFGNASDADGETRAPPCSRSAGAPASHGASTRLRRCTW